MLVSHLRNMRSVAIAFASVKLAPVGATVCRIDGVTRRRLTHLDGHDQRATMAMMLAAECPFVRLTYGPSDHHTSHTLSLWQASIALSRVHYAPTKACGACGSASSHVSHCPLA